MNIEYDPGEGKGFWPDAYDRMHSQHRLQATIVGRRVGGEDLLQDRGTGVHLLGQHCTGQPRCSARYAHYSVPLPPLPAPPRCSLPAELSCV
eukprot:COSAG06_NODE_5737_length_3300_cov_6.881287_3_plen_92_part_00